MPTILENVARGIRKKSLNDILRQAGMVRNDARKKGYRFLDVYNGILEHPTRDMSRIKQARNDHWNLEEKIERNLIPMDADDTFLNSYDSHLLKCFDKFPHIRDAYDKTNKNRREDCADEWWTEVLPGLLPSEDDIRLDPLNYTEHFNKYIRDFSRGLVDGSIE